MHFEIEGEIPLGAAGDDRDTRTPVDDEERGVYMLPDGEPIPSVTGMNHAQGSDSVGASSPGRLLVTGPRDVRVLDASETSARGATLGRSEQLLFQVYSVTYDPDAKLVAVCGAAGLAGDVNLAVFRLSELSETRARRPNTSDADSDSPARRDAEGSASRARDGDSVAASGPSADDSVMFIPVAEKGVGAVGRYGREMLNCVRFGKLARAEADDDASTSTRNVLVCASQDEHCYVLSIEVRGDNGPGGAPSRDDGDDASVSGSDGGQGGRGARRRPRLDATLVEEARLHFPVAVNAAAASPTGGASRWWATRISSWSTAARTGTERRRARSAFPIDGDPETLNVITGEPQGGMYAAWSPDSRYLAATSDSLHAVAVWRVHVSTSRTDGGEDLRCHRVAYLRDHAHPCLPIAFLPSDPNIVVWAERGGRVHAYDLRCAVAAAESTSSAVDLSPPSMRRPPRRRRGEAAEADADDGSGSGSRSDDGWELLPEEGVDVSLYPSAGGSEWDARDGNDQRRFVQTIRSRVRGLYVTGLCAVAAPTPPPRRRTDSARVPRSVPARFEHKPRRTISCSSGCPTACCDFGVPWRGPRRRTETSPGRVS